MWEDTAIGCQLHLIHTITPNQTQGTWLVDHHHQLLLNVTGVYPIPGCKLVLKTTQLDNVFLAELTAPEMQNIICGLPPMPPREVDRPLKRLCRQQHEALDSAPVQIQSGLFGLTHGDMKYKFSCPIKMTENLELEDC
ncbi:MAG: hypothetical protein GY696_39835 [Gammaproteobacteria bacterium]|nr:hypothetical protein [Gammaproteobacteria bacterium]